MEANRVQALIEGAIPEAVVKITGDGCNLEVLVISEAFIGKTLIQRHRMVMEAVKQHIASNELHALSIKTETP